MTITNTPETENRWRRRLTVAAELAAVIGFFLFVAQVLGWL